MTVPATARRAGPYNGNGSTTSFSFSFKTFANGDLQVTKTSTAGIESVLVLNSDYSVTLNPDQDTSPGGTITYPITGSALATGEKLTIVGDLDYEQTTDLLGGGAFNARVIEDTFDRATIQIQQLEERLDRALSLPVSVTASAVLPTPEASKVIGWNLTEDGLVNIDAASLASVTASAYVVVDKFTGDGTTTQFICSQLPGSTNAAEVTIAGVMQNPAVDYTVSGARVVFTSAPPNGAVIIVRFLVAASQSSGSAFTTERQVATAGQTVFNLANAYAPGADTLTVFVNGLLMSSTLDYAETSANVVTFTSGLTLNDEVVFHIWRTNTLTTADAANVSFLQAGTSAQPRSVQGKLRDVVSVKDFGAVGDGVTNDRAAIQAAFNASKSVYFPSGTYYLGAFSTATSIIDLSALGAGVSIRCDSSVELVCQTTASVMPRVFYLLNNTNFSCDPIRIRDTGYDPLLTWKGAIGFYLDCGASDNWGDVKISAIYGSSLVAPVTVAGGNASNRIRGIKIGLLFSDNCYYGFNAQNNGDGVAIDNLVAFQNYRPYLVYGCSDHRVKIFNRNNRSTTGAVNISRSPGGLNTSGIDVTYVARDMAVGITHVLINHIDLLGGEISNIRVNLDIRSSVVYTPLRFVNYTGSGGAETSAASSNLVYDVTVAGSCDVQAAAVTSVASYASRRQLNFIPGTNFFYDTTIPALFSLDRQTRSQPVTWTASVTNPVLGNGSLSGSSDLVAGLCTYSVAFTAGSTTTFGNGDWSFSAPFAATVTSTGSVWVLDSGTAYYIGTCKIDNGTSIVTCYANAAASGYRSTVPMTWATGDQLQLTITYPVS